jgi:ABC-type lipoprotein release transport system permease subunit
MDDQIAPLDEVVAQSVAERRLHTLLLNVSPLDPLTFVEVASIVRLTGVAAAYLPARRAARMNPVAVIRGE